jgi:hypothetical protein
MPRDLGMLRSGCNKPFSLAGQQIFRMYIDKLRFSLWNIQAEYAII